MKMEEIHIPHHEHSYPKYGHHHEDHSNEKTFPSVEIKRHENAVIGTVKCSITGKYEDFLAILRGFMEKTAEEVEYKGGFVGHIKAFAKETNRNCMVSIPEIGDIQVKESIKEELYVENANIIFGLSEEKLENILKTIYKKYLD